MQPLTSLKNTNQCNKNHKYASIGSEELPLHPDHPSSNLTNDVYPLKSLMRFGWNWRRISNQKLKIIAGYFISIPFENLSS